MQQIRAARYAQHWFTDIDELNATWLKVHTNRRLPLYKQVFCAQWRSSGIASRLLRVPQRSNANIVNVEDTLSFSNPPGPVGGGMCWLHSRLQRQFTYLANFRPELPRPRREDILERIDRIVHREGVTEIPGFRNLHELSEAYEAPLISAITAMGWSCIFSGDCLARIPDSFHPSADDVQSTMDQLHDRMGQQPGHIQFIRTRNFLHGAEFLPHINVPILDPIYRQVLAGLSAHSFLVLALEPLLRPGNPQRVGYTVIGIDPNSPHQITRGYYHYGNAMISLGGIMALPYLHYPYAGDIPEMSEQIAAYCRR